MDLEATKNNSALLLAAWLLHIRIGTRFLPPHKFVSPPCCCYRWYEIKRYKFGVASNDLFMCKTVKGSILTCISMSTFIVYITTKDIIWPLTIWNTREREGEREEKKLEGGSE